MSELLTVDDLAYLSVSPKTIYGYRYRGCGPEAIRLANGNGPLRFRREDVEVWLEENADTAGAAA